MTLIKFIAEPYVRRATEPEEYSRDSGDANEQIAYGDSRSSMDVHTPLMQEGHSSDENRDGEDNGEVSRMPSRRSHQVNASIDSMATGSAETSGSNFSTANLLGSQSGPINTIEEERGEAPPYMEHVEQPAQRRPPTDNSANPENRRSMASRMVPSQLRNLFSTGTRSRPQSQVGHSHSPSVPMVHLTEPGAESATLTPGQRSRADTDATVPDPNSSNLSLSRSRSPSNSGSRIAALGSALTRPLTNNSAISANSSLQAGTNLPTHQRNRSGSSFAPSSFVDGNRLTSPSSTSISSANISSPLAHTATRTDFRFPKSGPTPDQVKFLSSRETLGRFGVPFGEDAERTYPSQRPPPFQEASGSGSRHQSSNSNPENGVPSAGDQEPRRTRPASWWRNLTQPAGAHSPPKEPSADLPSTSTESSAAVSLDTAVTAALSSSSVPRVTESSASPTVDTAASIPLPLSARPSVRSVYAESLSLTPSPARTLSVASTRSRTNSASSDRTNSTFLTAADTVRAGSSSPGSDVGFDSGDEGDERREAPSTPTIMRRPGSLADSLHDPSFESINLDGPSAASLAAAPTTVAVGAQS